MFFFSFFCLMAMAGICATVHTVQYTIRSGVFDI